MKKDIKPTTILALRFRNAVIRLLFVTVAVVTALFFLFECRVRSVMVEGLVHVPEPAIMDTAGIRVGRHLYAISESKLARNITESSPYVRAVTLERTLPHTVTIRVEEYDLAYYVFFEGVYYLLSDDLLILEETTPEDAAELGAVPLLTQPIKPPKLPKDAPKDTPIRLTVGERIAFVTKSDLEWTQELLDAIRMTDYADNVTSIDLSDRYELSLTVSDKYTVLLGNEKDFARKLTRVGGALRHATETMFGVTGTVYARSDAPVTFEITGVIETEGT